MWRTLVIAVVLAATTTAVHAGRRRIVVLDFEGPKADKFHDVVERTVRKVNTTIATEKWNRTADDLRISAPTERDVRKISKRLKLDGVVTGVVRQRDGYYVLTLRLREGASGVAVLGPVEIPVGDTHLTSSERRAVKEFVASIDEVLSSAGDN